MVFKVASNDDQKYAKTKTPCTLRNFIKLLLESIFTPSLSRTTIYYFNTKMFIFTKSNTSTNPLFFQQRNYTNYKAYQCYKT